MTFHHLLVRLFCLVSLAILAAAMAAGLARFGGPVRILVAERDRTGQAFLASWNARDARLVRCPEADHAYSDDDSREWLIAQILAALAEE